MEAITHGEGRAIFNRRAPRSSDVNNVAHVKAERGKETMAFDNSQSLVVEVLGQAVGALSLIGETTESPDDT